MTFHVFEEAAYSTCSPEMARARVAAGLGGAMSEHRVPVKTLREILATHLPAGTRIDFLSVDVEGFEMEVLAGMNWEAHAPPEEVSKRPWLAKALPINHLFRVTLTETGFTYEAMTADGKVFDSLERPLRRGVKAP